MALSRRRFLKKAIFTWLGVTALITAAAGGIFLALVSSNEGIDGFGPIIKDRDQILDLPKGFSYKIIARAGDKMTDGFYVPGQADGSVSPFWIKLNSTPGIGKGRPCHPVRSCPFIGSTWITLTRRPMTCVSAVTSSGPLFSRARKASACTME